ncbi:MAG: PIG-L family deacetylase [Bacteroidota bacterium]
MKRSTVFLFILLLFSVSAKAQSSPQYNSAEILHKLNKLNTVGSVLYVAAHPDDENTRLLAYLANERKLRTGYLSLTRGDGGQNLIGKELGEQLGLIRTQELLAARRTDGAEQFFTRANDFGYSKNPQETFGFWNKDSILADVVWVIRNFRPDVIICRFPTDGRGGHGHHTASAILAEEAFEAAADPTRYPEQLQYVQVWQAKRVFWNSYNFGTTNTTTPEQMQLNVGLFNPLLGKGYGEIAADSRSNHKSQGFGSARGRGEVIEYFQQIKGDSVSRDLFEGINQTWARLVGTKKIQKQIDKIIEEYKPQSPERSVSGLVELYRTLQQLEETDAAVKYWKTQKLKETETLILTCAGLWMEAYALDFIAIPGEQITLTTQWVVNSGVNVELKKLNYLGQTDTLVNQLSAINKKGEYFLKLYSYIHNDRLPTNTPYSTPYWLRDNHTVGLYAVNDLLMRGKAENDPQVEVTFYVNIAGLELAVKRPVVYKYTDPVKGEVYRPLEVLPPATVNIAEQSYVFGDTTPQTVKFIVKANKNNVQGTLKAEIPAGWQITLKNASFSIANKGEEQVLEAVLRATPNSVNSSIIASLKIEGKTYNKAIQRVQYDHIPYRFTLSDAEAKLVSIPLQKTNITIGYIPGAGDEVANSLRLIGYKVVELTDDMLANDDLSKYGAIVTGIRAYNTNARLLQLNNRINEYINNGGNFIVQYNTNSRVGPFAGKIGPYDFTISRNRVTDETASVKFPNPEHPVLTYPNKIGDADFEGWVQERGIYFATELNENFVPVLEMADPNEEAQTGSLIIAPYGKGNFVYTGLSFFRELPDGVPGAYRLFVNLLSLPQNK